MKSITAKQSTPLFSAAGMIGTVAEQIQANPEVPYHCRKQAAKVEAWVHRAVDEIEHHLSDATARKVTRHCERFVSICASQKIVHHGMVDMAPVLFARLMAGHYALNYYVHKLGIKGPWRYLDMTAGTLLAMIADGGMGSYEAPCFAVAESLLLELAA